jgi:hypothetical protein
MTISDAQAPDVAAVVDRGGRVRVFLKQSFDHDAAAVGDRSYMAPNRRRLL